MPKQKRKRKNIMRENWKGKFYVVQRNKKGQIISRVAWSKTNTVKSAIINFKQSGSIKEDTKRFKLTNFYEVSIKGRAARKPRNRDYQVYVIVNAVGIEAEGRSSQHSSDYPKKEARNEALINALARAAGKLDFSDLDAANELIESGSYKILDEGIVYYSPI